MANGIDAIIARIESDTGEYIAKMSVEHAGKLQEIEKEKTPYSLCYILLYILYIKKKDLYDQLFVNDGGIDSLERVKNKKAEFQLFNNYFYQRAPLNKFLRIIENMKEAKK